MSAGRAAWPWTGECLCGGRMNRIRVYFFYQIGAVLNQLTMLQPGMTVGNALPTLLNAETELNNLLNQTLMPLRTSVQFTTQLIDTIKRVSSRPDRDSALDWMDIHALGSALAQFSNTLNGDTSIADTYVLSPKAGYDTTTLATNGEALFHADLGAKVPEALPDVRAAAQCLAFELPTAAGFHLHRANESVLHRYYDAVTGGKPRPSGRNIGDYLRELNNQNVGDPKVRSALKDLKDLHRNPLIHPEHTLENIDEAIDLLGSIRSLVGHMLRAIS